MEEILNHNFLWSIAKKKSHFARIQHFFKNNPKLLRIKNALLGGKEVQSIRPGELKTTV